VRRPGELLTRNELIEQVWPGRVVEENNLSVQVNTLRKLLGGEWLATVPGRGYRFIAPQEAARPADAAAAGAADHPRGCAPTCRLCSRCSSAAATTWPRWAP
jgi:DNA-binding winged helix-turn-helix (wHTH) protein